MTLRDMEGLVTDRRRFQEPLLDTFRAEPLPIALTFEDADERFDGHLLRSMYADERMHSGIPWSDGLNLYRIVFAEGLDQTLEVGLGFGFSALFCLQAHEDKASGRHIAIDPCQHEVDPRTLEKNEWNAGGLSAVRKARLDHRFHHRAEPDFLALPDLITQGTNVDLCLIDAMGLFDLVVMNAVQADMLLRTGGLLVFRICWPGIMKAVLFWLQNRSYTLLRVSPPCAQLVFLRKNGSDTRHWTEFHDF